MDADRLRHMKNLRALLEDPEVARLTAERAALIEALRQAQDCCARPRGVCFDPTVLPDTGRYFCSQCAEYHPADTGGVECPDGGTCHHSCSTVCFRTEFCEPLSGVFPNDEWPTPDTGDE